MDNDIRKQLNQSLCNLGNDKDFQRVMDWLVYEKEQVQSQLSGAQSSESLQRLSGSCHSLAFIIEYIKETQKRLG